MWLHCVVKTIAVPDVVKTQAGAAVSGGKNGGQWSPRLSVGMLFMTTMEEGYVHFFEPTVCSSV